MEYIDPLYGPGHEAIFEKKLELKRLNPDSRLLKYCCIHNHEESESSTLFLSSELKVRSEFERRFGDLRAPGFALTNYYIALDRAIRLINLQNRVSSAY